VTLRLADERLLVELRGKRTDLVPGARVSVRVPATALHRLGETPGSVAAAAAPSSAARFDSDRVAVFAALALVVLLLAVFVVVPLVAIFRLSLSRRTVSDSAITSATSAARSSRASSATTGRRRHHDRHHTGAGHVPSPTRCSEP
jgi:hypothetical protein